MHIAVIGAGAAGLCAARHISVQDSGMTCVVYEQTDKLGGTWVYTDEVGSDQYGLPIHSSMYKNLRTNLPKENMEFPGFPWKENPSYLSYQEVIDYLKGYAEHYKLKDFIKFHHHVVRVSPLETGWEVTACNLKTNENTVERFDCVMVCNGHYSIPDIPYIKGLQLFEGEIMHSHNYRTPEGMLGKTILVIGGGPSGIDISWDMSKYATKIYFTHHSPELLKIKFPPNIQQMPEVSELINNGVIFEDNSSCQVDVILLCTGYRHNFPFFTPECEVVVEQGRYVQPFYKHMIHVYKPTLCIIGLVYLTFVFPMFDIQIRYFLRTLSGRIQLPSIPEMLQDIDDDIQKKCEDGFKLKHYHKLGPGRVKPYLDNLSELGQYPPLPHVIFRIFENVIKDRKTDLANYRKVEYRVIDDIKYTRNGVLIE